MLFHPVLNSHWVRYTAVTNPRWHVTTAKQSFSFLWPSFKTDLFLRNTVSLLQREHHTHFSIQHTSSTSLSFNFLFSNRSLLLQYFFKSLTFLDRVKTKCCSLSHDIEKYRWTSLYNTAPPSLHTFSKPPPRCSTSPTNTHLASRCGETAESHFKAGAPWPAAHADANFKQKNKKKERMYSVENIRLLHIRLVQLP